jgi:hypothetical protein
MTTNTPTPCETCGGTGIVDCGDYTKYCPVCLDEGYCPRCGADNVGIVSVDGDGYTWAWDGETPCPACGWDMTYAAQQVQP